MNNVFAALALVACAATAQASETRARPDPATLPGLTDAHYHLLAGTDRNSAAPFGRWADVDALRELYREERMPVRKATCTLRQPGSGLSACGTPMRGVRSSIPARWSSAAAMRR